MIKSVFRGLLWSTIGKIINASTKFFSVPLMLAYFAKENFGLLALAFSVNVYMKIMDMGFNIGNVKFISSWIPQNKNEEINKLVQSSISFYTFIGFINSIVLLFISVYSKTIFNLPIEDDLILKKLLYILAFSSIISWASSISNQVLKAYERIDFDEKLIIITNVLNFSLVFATIQFNLSLTVYFLFHSVFLVIMYPVRFYKCKNINKNIEFKFRWHPAIFKEVLKYSVSIFFLSIFQFSATNLRPIIISIQSEITEVTDYSIMQQITSLILVFTGSFMGILLPIVSKLDPLNDKERTNKIVIHYTKIIALLVTSLVFGLILISKPFIILYLGVDYLYIRFWLILWALSFLGTHNTAISAIVLAQKSVKKITYFTMFSSVVSLTVCWFTSSLFGVGGAVISLIVYICFQLSFYYIYYIPRVMKIDSLKVFIYSFIIPVCLGLVSSIAVHFSYQFIVFENNLLEIILKSISYGILFLLLINFFSIKIRDISKTLNL